MPRIRNIASQPWAEMIVVALLCYSNNRSNNRVDKPNISGFKCQIQGQKVEVIATPDILVALIKQYADCEDFVSLQKNNLVIWRKKLGNRDRYEQVRDAISAMAEKQIITEVSRKQGNPKKERDFSICFHYPLIEIEKNLAWFQEKWKVPLEQLPPEELVEFTAAKVKLLKSDPKVAMDVIGFAKLKIAEYKFEIAEKLLLDYVSHSDRFIGSKVDHYLGVIYQCQTRFSLAKEYLERALQGFNQLQSPKDIAATHHHLGVVCTELRDWQNATYHLEQAIELRGADFESCASSRQALGNMFVAMGDVESAKEIYLDLIEKIKSKKKLKNNIVVAFCHNGLAGIYARNSEYEQAKIEYEKAINMVETADSENHGSLPNIKASLAAVYFMLNDVGLAEKIYIEALNQAIGIYGKSHAVVATIMADFGFCFGKLEKYKEVSIKLLSGSIEILKAIDANHSMIHSKVEKLNYLKNQISCQ
jgi:tetratricopeptide (TPR) repeat protein